MKLAVNYSPQAADLLARGEVRFDLFKCPDWPDMIAAAQAVCPTYVHFSLRAGRGGVDAAALDRIADLLETTETREVSTHLAPHGDGFPGMPLDTREPEHVRRVIAAAQRDVNALVDRFGARRVSVENTMWAPDPPHRIPRPALEAGTIDRVVRRTNVGLVLDLAHARCTAKFLDVGEREYIRSLPTDRLRELHVSGTREEPNGLWEDHFEMSDDDATLTEWAFDRIRQSDWPVPWVTTLEYGGTGGLFRDRSDADALRRQLTRLDPLVRSIA